MWLVSMLGSTSKCATSTGNVAGMSDADNMKPNNIPNVWMKYSTHSAMDMM